MILNKKIEIINPRCYTILVSNWIIIAILCKITICPMRRSLIKWLHNKELGDNNYSIRIIISCHVSKCLVKTKVSKCQLLDSFPCILVQIQNPDKNSSPKGSLINPKAQTEMSKYRRENQVYFQMKQISKFNKTKIH